VEGSVRGRVAVRGKLEIAAGAVVEGFVQAGEIDVRGRLSGVVRAAGEVRLHPEGEVTGDVEAPRVRFVKGEAPHEAAAAAPAPPPSAEEAPALPPLAAGQVPAGTPWPPRPQSRYRSAPVWAPRSARPAAETDPASAPPPSAPAPEAEDEAPALPAITGTERQIVVRRR
jgi:hypothetical protein